MNSIHFSHRVGLIFSSLFHMFSFPLDFQTNALLIPIRNIWWERILINHPWQDSKRVRNEINYKISECEATWIMILHILEKKTWYLWMAKKGIHSSDLPLDRVKITLKLTSQESQYKYYACLISHIARICWICWCNLLPGISDNNREPAGLG